MRRGPGPPVPSTGPQRRPPIRFLSRLLPLLLLALVNLGVAAEGVSCAAGERAWRQAPDADTIPRMWILGFDGVDPRVLQAYFDAGELPALAGLAKAHGLHGLQSEIPPESPVAWASMQTGLNPAGHSIYDFVGREPEETGYQPVNGMVDFSAPPFLLGKVPTRPPRVRSRLAAPTFLELVSRAGYPVLGLRPPLTFPARPMPGARVLSGLGTPDLAGTNGAYAYYRSGLGLVPEYTTFNGHNIHLAGGAKATTFSTYLEGPYDRTRRDASGAFPRVTVPLRFHRTLPDGPVTVELGGTRESMTLDETTGWMRAEFDTPTIPSVRLSGRVRFRLRKVEPLEVLAEPVHLDPSAPAIPISTPPGFAAELERAVGPYPTLGWLEPTFPLNDGLLSPAVFVKHTLELMDRDHAILRACLKERAALVFHVFTQTDRAAHCLWWLRDPEHPFARHADASAFEGRDPLLEVYRKMDAVVADVISRLAPRDTLLVVSDHGFQSFRYGFNVNQWLLNEGYLVLKDPGQRVAESNLTQFFGGSLSSDAVDWSRSRAYALGLGQIYLNRRGREPQGIVEPSQVRGLVDEISARLLAFRDERRGGRAPLAKVYDLHRIYRGPHLHRAAELQLGFAADYRVSWQTALLSDLRPPGTPPVEDNKVYWSGDHCSTDRDLVPGILLTNRALPVAPADAPYGVRDVAATVLSHFGLPTGHLDGRPLPLR